MEHFENVCPVFVCNADTDVGHGYTEKTVCRFPTAHGYASTILVKFYGIGKKVQNDLLKTHGIRAQMNGRAITEGIDDHDVPVFAQGHDKGHTVGYDAVDLYIFKAQRYLVGFDPRQIKDVVDEDEKVIAAADNTFDMFVLRCRKRLLGIEL